MKLIAIEEHFLTPAIRTAWENSLLGTEGTNSFEQRPEIAERLEDLGEGRIALMDEAGVDVQVLSVSTPALQNLEPEESIHLARQTNDLLAGAIASHPARFQGFATFQHRRLKVQPPSFSAVSGSTDSKEPWCAAEREMNVCALYRVLGILLT